MKRTLTLYSASGVFVEKWEDVTEKVGMDQTLSLMTFDSVVDGKVTIYTPNAILVATEKE